MKIPKASDENKQRFRDLLDPLTASRAATEIKPMFGQLAGFVNGNMFAGIFGSSIGVKLPAIDAAELRELGGGPFGPDERPMGGYVSIPSNIDASHWLERAHAYVALLPTKVSKTKQ